MAEQAGQAEPPAAAVAATTKKRRRPPLSCEQCRRRKIKCDRAFPCDHCVRADAGPCTYAPTHTPKPRRRPMLRASAGAARSGLSSPAAGSVSLRPAGAATVVNIRPTARATQIHTPDSEEFHRASAWQPLRPASAAAQRQDEDPETHRPERAARGSGRSHGEEARRPGEVSGERHQSEYTPPPKGSISKGRYFGQSHWMNIAASFPVELSMLKNQEYTQGELFRILYQCKVLCQKIKTIRFQPLSSLDIGKNMLPRDVCDDLVEAYLRTFEGVYRILHIPTFRKEYASYWEDPCSSNEAFVVLMQLCAVLGSSVRTARMTAALKKTTTRWIYEAHMWLMLPPEKGRMTLTGVQVRCLLTLAKMTCGISADLTWVMAGALLRTAMYMGLHRDPSRLSSETSVYRAEMRRRLWATILELNLLYAFEAGGMPLVSCDDYDTLPPADLDDDALNDDSLDDVRRRVAASKSATQMSVPLAVFRSLPLRMELLRYINDFRAGVDYDKTLRLNSELTKACRSFTQTISALTRHQDGGAASSVSAGPIAPFHVALAEMTLYRCFHALHFPVLFTAFDDPRFYFSRKMCLDGALKIADLLDFTRPPRPPESDFERLVIHGTGMFKNIPVQVACIVALELIHDKAGGGPGLGPSLAPAAESHAVLLRTCLDGALGWMLDRMRAGEVTAKGHCFLSACVAHTEALERGLDKAATMALLVSRATEAARVDLELLRDVARDSGVAVAEEEEEEEAAADQTQGQSSEIDVGAIEALAASWDGGGGGISWAWDEADDWMWGGAWSSQLNVPMPLDNVRQFFEAPVGYPR